MKLRVQQEQQLWRRHVLASGAFERAARALDDAVVCVKTLSGVCRPYSGVC
jgi:hypothetical protein